MPRKGYKQTAEHRAKLSMLNKGKISPLKGKTIAEIVGIDRAEARLIATIEAAKKGGAKIKEMGPWNKGISGWKQKNPNPHRRTKGLSYEERYGPEKGAEIRKKVGNIRRVSYPWTEAMKLAARTSTIERIISGKTHPHLNYKAFKKKIVTFKAGEVICQSTWEIILCKWLDANTCVASYLKDKIRLVYSYNNKKRIYIVDFLVIYSSGVRELVEVKPSALLNDAENPSKFEVAKQWCLENNAEFVILTEHELKLIGEL